MVEELEGQNYVRVRRARVVDHDQDVVTPTGRIRPNMEQFSEAQRTILDMRIAEFRSYTNIAASDESHKRSAGWLTREQGETIPYVSSIINPEPLDPDVLAGLRTKVPS